MKTKDYITVISFLVISISFALYELFITKNYSIGLLIIGIVTVTYYFLFIFKNFELIITEDTFQITNSKKVYNFKDVVKVDWLFHSERGKKSANDRKYTKLVLTLNSGAKVFISPIYSSDFWTVIEKVRTHNPEAYFISIIPENEEDFIKLQSDWENNVSDISKKVIKGIVIDNAKENNLTEEESKKDLIITGIKELAIVGGIIFIVTVIWIILNI